MTGWLAKATQVLGKHEPAEPVPFNIPCGCGNRVSGTRRSVFQVVLCNRCGTSVFVLPLDVYPKPKVKAKKKKRAAPKGGEGKPSTAKAPLASDEPPPPTWTQSLRGQMTQLSRTLAGIPKVFFTPIRLIAMAIVAVILGTGYFVWNSRANENARLALPVHVANGDEALHDRNITKAADEFKKAARAVERLGRNDPEAQRVRQKSRELAAIVNLSAISLYEICEEAQRALKAAKGPDGERNWLAQFNQLHRGAWLVIEGTMPQLPGPDGVMQPAIRYPFPIDDAAVLVDARLPALSELPEKGAPRKVIFAGQLESLRKEGAKSPVWMVRLNERTAFLWADEDTYQALVSGDDPPYVEATRRILNEQAAAIGIKP